MKKIVFLTLAFIFFTIAKSQHDTALYKSIDEITISASRFNFFTNGTRKDATDSILQIFLKSVSISQILNASGSLNVRSYGPSSLATSTMRGGNSNQTAINWNGFSINNPVNGLFDFNLLPSFMFDQIMINPGISSSIQGSGGIGGGINLQNNSDNKSEISSFLSLSSFSGFSGGIKNVFSLKKIKNTSKVFYSKSQNDFTFKNFAEAGNPKQKITNSATNLVSFLNELSFKDVNFGFFKVSYWATSAHRQIPPTMLMSISKAIQNDVLNKVMLNWEKSKGKFNYKVNSIFQNDFLKYKDEDVNINSITKNNTITNDFELRYKQSKKMLWGFGISYSKTTARVQNITITDTSLYNSSKRNQLSTWLSNIYKIDKINTEISFVIRQDYTDSRCLPTIPSIGYKTVLNKKITIFGQFGKTYRIPTLNDLYWNPGGNINLKAEWGFQGEQSLEYYSKFKKTDYKITFTCFSRVVNNQIQWQPVSLQIWSPFNIGKVYSRGLELRSEIRSKITKKLYHKISTNISLTKSENINNTDKNYGKQIIYVPIYNSSFLTSFIYCKTALIFQLNLIGKRYTSNDNVEFLDSYEILNIYIKHTLNFKKNSLDFFIKTNNILNKMYQEIAWRPMPGRNYEAGINFNFKRK